MKKRIFEQRCFGLSSNSAWLLQSPYLTAPVFCLMGPHETVPQAFLSESPQWSRPQTPDLGYWDQGTRITSLT